MAPRRGSHAYKAGECRAVGLGVRVRAPPSFSGIAAPTRVVSILSLWLKYIYVRAENAP